MSVRCGMMVVALLGCTNVTTAQWTQWGGPHQDFKAEATGLADRWGADGPKHVWERDLGEGYSAILVDGGRLYTMYRPGDQEAIVCLDSASGKTIWEYRYRSDPAEGHVMQFGAGPRATPLIVGDRIYTIGVSGTMHCLNKADGKPYWSKELWKDLGGNVLNHGYASSPIAYKDTVIVLVGGKGASIVAFDQASGDVVWKKHDFENSYSTPKVIDLDGTDHLVTFMANEIVGVDPNNGDLKWRYEIGNQWGQNVCLPIWDDETNTLFFSVAEVGSRGLKLTRKGDNVETEELWKTRKIQFYHVTSVNVGDYVFGSHGAGAPNFFAAINITTGKIAWRKRGFSKATCVYADGRLIILDDEGNLALATVTPKDLTVHSKYKVFDDTAWTVPTVVGSTLYVRDKHKIMALDLS